VKFKIDSKIFSLKGFFSKCFSHIRKKTKEFLEGSLLIPLNFMEDDKSITVTAEIPDVDEKTIEISFENNLLTMRGEGEKRRGRKNKNKESILEKRFGKFQRSVIVNDLIDESGITAFYQEGTLIIYLPKRSTKSNKKYIPILKGSF
jgi:HSP20 family protein